MYYYVLNHPSTGELNVVVSFSSDDIMSSTVYRIFFKDNNNLAVIYISGNHSFNLTSISKENVVNSDKEVIDRIFAGRDKR